MVKIALSICMHLTLVLRPIPPFASCSALRRSIIEAVISSSWSPPNGGSSHLRTVPVESTTVEYRQPRSFSPQSSQAFAAAANVPVSSRGATPNTSTPRRRSVRTASCAVCAVRFVKCPSCGRPRPVHTGPIVWFFRLPSAKRILAYQTEPRLPS
jgi:hypothetical protein